MAKISASHILVKSETEALACLTYLKPQNSLNSEGAQKQKFLMTKKFEELAKEKSLCPSGKKGGSLGWFTRGMMVREFEQAVFSAKKDQIIGPIKTPFGYHLIRIDDIE